MSIINKMLDAPKNAGKFKLMKGKALRQTLHLGVTNHV